jgi:hypothetical protein
MLKILIQILQMFFGGNQEQEVQAAQPQPKQPTPPQPDPSEKKEKPQGIDWTDPNAEISRYFTVKNAIWLPQWNRLANPEQDSLTQDSKDALVKLFTEVMDPVRELIGKPIKVHVAFRSPEYNVLIGGARMSIHMARKYEDGSLVAACDWSADMGKGSPGANCDELKSILTPKLEELGVRMENNGQGATWIHLDNRKPGPGGRFFKP